MCIRVLTIFKCACPHRNTLVCPHHVHVLDPSTTSSDFSSSDPHAASRPTTSCSSSESPAESPFPSSETTTTTSTTEDEFQKGFHPRLPSALQGHKSWTPLPGKENQRWEHCPGYLAKSRALLATTTNGNGKPGGDVTMVGKETQCAEYKATEPKYRRRWEVKTGLCEECKGVHGMDGPSEAEKGRDGGKRVVVVGKGMRMGMGKGKGKGNEEERGRARNRAVTDPTPKVGAMLASVRAAVPMDGGGNTSNVVKGVSGKVVGKRVVRKRIATL